MPSSAYKMFSTARSVVVFALMACYIVLISDTASADAMRKTRDMRVKNKPKSPPKMMPTTFPTIAAAAKAYNLTILDKAISMTSLHSATTIGATAITLFAPTDKASNDK